MELVNKPLPVPSVVLLSFTVGAGESFQQTPLSVISPEPSSVMLPPETALVFVIDVISDVDSTGRFSTLQFMVETRNKK